MRKHLVIAVIIVVGAFIGVTAIMLHKQAGQARPPMKGDMAEFKLQYNPVPVPRGGSFIDETGKAMDFTAFKGKVTLVNFWAAWCEPCIREMPALDRLKHARDGDNFQVVTISEDPTGQIAITNFYKKASIQYLPHYSDSENSFPRVLKLEAFPVTLLLDADGNEIGRFDTGAAQWDMPDAGRLLDFYIKPKPNAG